MKQFMIKLMKTSNCARHRNTRTTLPTIPLDVYIQRVMRVGYFVLRNVGQWIQWRSFDWTMIIDLLLKEHRHALRNGVLIERGTSVMRAEHRFEWQPHAGI